MNRLAKRSISVVLLTVFILVGCIFSSSSVFANVTPGTLIIRGSTTIEPIIRAIAPDFITATGLTMDMSFAGSGDGFNKVRDLLADVGCMSKDLSAAQIAQDPSVQSISIGRDAIAIVINAGSPVAAAVSNLTKAQLTGIFSSSPTITNWSAVGGPDHAISVITRAWAGGLPGGYPASGTGEHMKDYLAIPGFTGTIVAESSDVVTAVGTNDYAIGYVSFGFLNDTSIEAVDVNGIECTLANAVALTNPYPIVRFLNLITKRDSVNDTLKFELFCLSPAGQNELSSAANGYIKINNPSVIVQVSNTNSKMKQLADLVRDELQAATAALTSQILFPTSSVGESNVVANVLARTADIGIIGRNLTTSELNDGLVQRTVALIGSTTPVNVITLGLPRGAEEIYYKALKNPRGQKIALKYGLFRDWVFGDVDGTGTVNSADYIQIRQYLLLTRTSFTGTAWLFSADVTGDGRINSADYIALRQFLLLTRPAFDSNTTYTNYYPPNP